MQSKECIKGAYVAAWGVRGSIRAIHGGALMAAPCMLTRREKWMFPAAVLRSVGAAPYRGAGESAGPALPA